MTIARQQLLELLKDLPDEVTIDDFIRKINEIKKIAWNSKLVVRKAGLNIGVIIRIYPAEFIGPPSPPVDAEGWDHFVEMLLAER
jgi:hypothetical protein